MVQGRENPPMTCRCQKVGIGEKSAGHRSIYKACDLSYAISYYFSIFTTHKTVCAPMYDGVSEITFQRVMGETCSNTTLFRFDDLLLRPKFRSVKKNYTYAECSSSVIEIADGLYGKSFHWKVGYQVMIQVSKTPQLHHCTTRDNIYIAINVVCNRDGTPASDLMHIYIWKMEQDKFNWTVWDSVGYTPNHDAMFNSYVTMYILVKSHSLVKIPLYPNISCSSQTMHLEHRVEESQRNNHKVKTSSHGRDDMHCLLSTCYIIYRKQVTASWNSAQQFCQQRNLQLLKMNSDIKVRFIENISYGYWNLYFPLNPVLFLNMKANKVCAISRVYICICYSKIVKPGIS